MTTIRLEEVGNVCVRKKILVMRCFTRWAQSQFDRIATRATNRPDLPGMANVAIPGTYLCLVILTDIHREGELRQK